MNRNDLRHMFGATPRHFTQSIEHTLHTLPEEKPMRTFTLRTALLVGALLVLLTAIAIAAIHAPSIQDFYDTFYGRDSDLAQHVARQQSRPQQLAFSLPDIDITLTEVIFDGDTLFTTGVVAPKEGHNVVVICSNYNALDPAYLDPLYSGLDAVPEGHPSYAQVAAETNAKLLGTWVDVEAEGGVGSYMLQPIPLTDGTYSFVGEFSGARVRDGKIEVTLSAGQYEVSPQGYEIPDTEARNAWTFPVPALADATPPPSPSPPPARTLLTPPPDEPVAGDRSAEPPLPHAADRAAAPSPGGGSPLIVVGGSAESDLTQAYLALHPWATLSFPDFPWDEGLSAATRFVRDGESEWDILHVSTNGIDLPALMAANCLAPLSGKQELASTAARFYPRIQEALSHDGVLYAYPDWIWDTNWQTDVRFGADAWAAAGYTEADLPETLSGLYALLDGWLDLPPAQRPRGVIEDNGTGSPTRATLLEMLLHRYNDYLYANALPPRYDASTPFYGLLMELDMLADRIEAEEAKNGRLTLAGYSDRETGSGVVLQPRYRVVADTPYLRGSYMNVYIVNPKSPRLTDALAYLSCVPESTDAGFLAQFYQDAAYEEFPNTDLDADVAVREGNIAHWTAELAAAKDDAARADAQATLDRVTRLRDELLAFPYLVPQSTIDDFRANDAPCLLFPSQSPFDTDRETWLAAHDLQQRYLAGQLSAEDYADGLNALAIEVERAVPASTPN